MSESEIMALLKSINIKVEALQAQMIMFQEALQPDKEYRTDPRVKDAPKLETQEYIIQDLNEILIFKKLDKSYVVLKNGYTTVVAYSHLKSGDGLTVGYFGDLNDDLHEDRKWILKSKKDGTPNLIWKPWVESVK